LNYSVGAAVSIAVGDFNGDGNTDLAVANQSGSVSILLGSGNGAFQAGGNYGTGSSPSSVVVGDFNGDGKADLAVANSGSANVSVFLGNGDGSFRSGGSYPANTQPASLTVSDVNGDGNPDLVVSNNAGDSVTILFGNGDGTFQPSSGFGAGAAVGVAAGPLSVAKGDFNGDGIPDLAAVYPGSNFVNLFVGNNAGVAPTAVKYLAGSQPSSVAVADFNGDGRSDLVVANQGSNSVSILLASPTVLPTVGIDALPAVIGGSSAATITGWAFDNFLGGGQSIASVTVKVDGVTVGNATVGGVRNDICLVYSYSSNCPIVGYTYPLNTSGITSGTHTITVLASDTGANVGSASVSVMIVPSIPPSVAIDSPSPNAALAGVITVSGWAIDNTTYVGSAIGSVVVKVDGVPMGLATYGVNRTDVCSAYPQRANCPNVGYTYQLNTSGLSTGNHTLTVSATDTDAAPDTGSASITISTSNVPPLVAIDAPLAAAVVSGTVTVSGWAIDNGVMVGTAISSVQVEVDGSLVGSATYGINRQDVCMAYPGRPGCPNVGYSYALNTSGLSAGSHVITVLATDSDGIADFGSRSVTVTVANPLTPAPTVYIDSLASGAAVSGTVTLSGWAIDSVSAIGSVQVKVDGTVVGNATYGIARSDVCLVYPGRPGCPNVGFTYQLNAASLSAGSHFITVVATDTEATPQSSSYSLSITR
jgi:hypothetical protein